MYPRYNTSKELDEKEWVSSPPMGSLGIGRHCFSISSRYPMARSPSALAFMAEVQAPERALLTGR